MFFTLRYHPDNKNSEDAEQIRNALRQRGFEWDEVAEEKDDVWELKMQTVLETPFVPKYTTPDCVENRLSHITIANGQCYFDGMDAASYFSWYMEHEVPETEEV